MNFTILHSSRGRPEKSLLTVRDILCKTSGKHGIKYIMGIDENDPKKNLYNLNSKSIIKLHSGFEFKIFDSKNYVECVNNLGKFFLNDVCLIASDDFVLPVNWDLLLVKEIEKHPELDNDFVVDVFDGYQSRIMTFPIFSQKYYQRFNYVYYPEYESIYSDTQFTEVAHKLNRVINARNILFEHQHWSFNKRQKDKTDENHSGKSRYEQGEKIFKYQESINFGIKYD